ncbi:X-ray radiation resistance-associated protein 1 isoform X1 [Esox lucius]|uniref:X-ray radiation resistance-associated protein 1 isoform X1 n=1 Tax=Esox lucius TaxID=8010 RepID=UPI001476EB1D|nr:X-ray radiation resistance-associated protein 1 isoform X1 [Esox lucius]
MASAGFYKFDDNDDVGNSYTANCFPIRSFFHQRKEGAGHWLVAHRNAVEHKYWNRKTEGIKYASKSILSECTGTSDSPGSTLDAHLLLSLHCVDKPSDLCSVDISEQKLNLVKTEDLLDFENVAYVNASDNCLTIEPFGKFPSLRELELSLNGLCNVTLNTQDFPHLEVLDLSYNNLSGDSILSIGLIPCLKVLHLTGNQLQSLPPNMAVHCHGSSQRTKDNGTLFHCLEVLMLDDNKLSSGVFSSLANLKRLQHLNLQGNNITEVPEVLPKNLQQKGYFNQQESDKQHSVEQKIKNHHVFEGSDTKYMNANITKHLHQDVKNSSEAKCVQSKTHYPTHISLETEAEDVEELSGAYAFPLPELCFLNLADNKIVEEEALLSVALFPMLREIVIHSNPLTTQKSGDPPLLTSLLQERLGIQISRKKPPAVVKPPMTFSIDTKRKIKTNIPKVPKVSLLMLLEAPCTSAKHDPCSLHEKHVKCCCRSPLLLEGMSTKKTGCTSQSKNHENEQESIGATDDAVKSSDDTFQKGASFFVTQVTDLHYESENHLLSDEKGVKELEKNAIPGKFKGYELLLDAKPDPDMVEPVGIQHTVRMLKQMLNTLLVYRDSKPNLDCIQKPYTVKEKKVGNLPKRQKKQREERVQEMLIQMKERKAIRKIPLSSVLTGKGVSKKEYEEALALLRHLKTKYKMVYMQAVEQATHIECEAISDQD